MPPKALIEFEDLPQETVLDQEGIRRYNRHRGDWEHLNGITLLDFDRRLAVGYKNCRTDEPWCRDHFPGKPILPGVVMIEAAAQVCSAYVSYFKLIAPNELLAFGGIDDARFRGEVLPGDRLWLVCYAERNTVRRTIMAAQGFVNGNMVFHANILGLAIPAPPDLT
jgi:3-hydroxyacyl-[acyl-carrier-protein] dehydratase